ncbi:hypothetical protein GGI12_003588 [Dipsacomyces acuminosporus]|nr:hypothetical protein GGI12_003588 [Dipsacomyces acuminosporus]
MAGTRLHSSIQSHISAFADLVPVKLHALWISNSSHFVRAHLVKSGVIDYPRYWYSPSQKHQVGIWNFCGKQIPSDAAIPETTLLTLLDDATAELATRIVSLESWSKDGVGFTVNLNITRTGSSSAARMFYFDAYTTLATGTKIVVECPLFDAETGQQLLVARGTFVFMTAKAKMRRMENEVEVDCRVPPKLIDAADTVSISSAELHSLGHLMDVVPYKLTTHKVGSFSTSKKRLAAVLDFGPDLSGPPMYVHGGVLGTSLYNASVLLFSKITGIAADAASAAFRDINYRKGIPLECEDVIIDAFVETADKDKTVIFARIMRGEQEHTTLKTVFVANKQIGPRSRL